MNWTDFEADLTRLLNQHSLEGDSDTPDYILAKMLTAQLKVFGSCARARERWHGEKPEQTMPKVDGKPFRCACGCNVFMRRGDRYTCNGCRNRYEGVPHELDPAPDPTRGDR